MTEYNWDLQTFWMEAMTRISSNTHEKLVPPQLCLFCVCSGSFAVKSGCFFSLIIYVQSKKRCFHETFETYHKSTWTFLWYFTGFTKLKLFPFPSFCCDCLALRSAEGNGNSPWRTFSYSRQHYWPRRSHSERRNLATKTSKHIHDMRERKTVTVMSQRASVADSLPGGHVTSRQHDGALQLNNPQHRDIMSEHSRGK